MKHIILSALGAVAAATAMAAPAATYLKIDSMQVARHDSILAVDITIDPSDIRPGRDREVVFTPVLRSATGADSLELDAVTVAGHNRYYLAERHGLIAEGDAIYKAGKGTPITYRRAVAWQPWMTQSQLDMRQDVANCCDPLVGLDDTPLARLDYTVKPFEPGLRYIALTGDSTVELTAEGRAYIDFIVNRTDIRPAYRRNNIELPKILASIDKVKNDPDATITRLTIKGYASPEGSYDNNVRLAMGRTQALKEYVREHYNFDPEIMHTDYEPEDWDGLREWLDSCTLVHRAEIIDIVDSNMAPDPKDHEIKRRYPEEYKLILDSVYPGLRHSDYTVKYRIRTFVDIDELKRVYAATPERLRPVDFYRIATTYPEGSAEWDDVLMTAVRIWPNDPEANVNAANIALKHGDVKAAAAYARRGGETPEAIYTRAILAARQGDRSHAAELLKTAAELGYEPAAQELAELRAVEALPTVEYLIECAH